MNTQWPFWGWFLLSVNILDEQRRKRFSGTIKCERSEITDDFH